MKIVILTQSLGVGGAERQFIQLAQGLQARGHEVRIVALHVFSEGWGWMQQNHLISIHHLYDRVPTNPVWAVLQFIVRYLRRIFTKEQIEIAHAVNTGLTATLLVLATMGRNKPIMVWGQRGGYGVKKKTSHHKWTTLISRTVSHRAAALISNSLRGEEILKNDGFRCRQFHVVPNGTDTQRFRRDEAAGCRLRATWGFDKGTRIIGFVGRPVPVKGTDIFLQAAARLAESHDDVRFVLLGGRHEQSQREHRAMAESLHIRDRIRWELDRSDMPAFYAAIDISMSSFTCRRQSERPC